MTKLSTLKNYIHMVLCVEPPNVSYSFQEGGTLTHYAHTHTHTCTHTHLCNHVCIAAANRQVSMRRSMNCTQARIVLGHQMLCVRVRVYVCAKRDIYYCEGVVITLFHTTYYGIMSPKMSFLKIINYQPVFHSQHLTIYSYICGSPRYKVNTIPSHILSTSPCLKRYFRVTEIGPSAACCIGISDTPASMK